MADADSQRCVSALLNGITQRLYYGNTEITEEFLKNELYAEMTQDEFRALHDKMRSLLKVLSPLQQFLTAETIKILQTFPDFLEYSRDFWKVSGNFPPLCNPSKDMLNRSKWTIKVFIMLQNISISNKCCSFELYIHRRILNKISEFVCLEFDEQKVNLVLKKMAELQESIDSMVHRS
uniref:Copper metabolism (Murr1) domain containing 1 n=1 Tax=Sinocyclocheilus rhinocerous TaxID=307959 RepID=A0A673GGS4_9TELE